MKTLKLILTATMLPLLASCVVSRSKYELAESQRLAAIYSRDSLGRVGDSLRTVIGNEREAYARLEKQNSNLCFDTTQLRSGLRNYQTLLNANKTERDQLNTLLNEKMKELGEREETINQLRGNIDDLNRRTQDLLYNVKDALHGFTSDELTIREEGGKVYVAMSDKLLFESASATVNEQGKEALGKLAEVLNQQIDIDVYIEGHTDSIPIHTAIYQDNWDLSVIRATSVVRILIETHNVNPLQIQPCGRGEMKPVDSNSTAAGRARNRRTEIIIAPRLDKLYKLIRN